MRMFLVTRVINGESVSLHIAAVNAARANRAADAFKVDRQGTDPSLSPIEWRTHWRDHGADEN